MKNLCLTLILLGLILGAFSKADGGQSLDTASLTQRRRSIINRIRTEHKRFNQLSSARGLDFDAPICPDGIARIHPEVGGIVSMLRTLRDRIESQGSVEDGLVSCARTKAILAGRLLQCTERKLSVARRMWCSAKTQYYATRSQRLRALRHIRSELRTIDLVIGMLSPELAGPFVAPFVGPPFIGPGPPIVTPFVGPPIVPPPPPFVEGPIGPPPFGVPPPFVPPPPFVQTLETGQRSGQKTADRAYFERFARGIKRPVVAASQPTSVASVMDVGNEAVVEAFGGRRRRRRPRFSFPPLRGRGRRIGRIRRGRRSGRRFRGILRGRRSGRRFRGRGLRGRRFGGFKRGYRRGQIYGAGFRGRRRFGARVLETKGLTSGTYTLDEKDDKELKEIENDAVRDSVKKGSGSGSASASGTASGSAGGSGIPQQVAFSDAGSGIGSGTSSGGSGSASGTSSGIGSQSQDEKDLLEMEDEKEGVSTPNAGDNK
jgi:hypothetical protein